jgi:hypothetical protein
MPAQDSDNKQARGAAWIIAKAAKNEEFRLELLKSPEAVVERELGITLEPGMTVRVLEDTAKTKHLVIPAKPEVPKPTPVGGHLSDAELLALLNGKDDPIGISFCPNQTDNI